MKDSPCLQLAALISLASPSLGQTCTNFGTPLSNGFLYSKNTPGSQLDPGISLNSDAVGNTDPGVIAGSSVRLQDFVTGGFSGITYQSDCAAHASITLPAWGGSGRGFWDNASGIPSGSIPGSFNDPTLDVYACWSIPQGSNYIFDISVTFANDTTTSGLYFEQLAPDQLSTSFSIARSINGGLFQLIGTQTSANPNALGAVTEFSSGSTMVNAYFLTKDDASFVAGDSVTYRIIAPGNGIDPVIGDIAILGQCCVPEPSTLLCGLLGLGLAFQRRRS